MDDWEQVWRETVDRVQEAVTEGPIVDDCDDTLGYLRERRPLLTPPPLEDLADPVDAWFDLAEHTFFLCELDDAATEQGPTLERLRTFESEGETGLSLES